MTLFEMRILAVVGFLALGAIAVVVSLAIVNLQRLARRLNNGMPRERALPSLERATHESARLLDRRQAAWRLRC
jgi:hypothetical protein